jgi:hypothetical protein
MSNLRGPRARRRRRGSQLVEAGISLTIFTALLLLVIDLGWGLFVKSTLQHAVSEGVRYGITSRTAPGTGQVASIRAVVLYHAMGLLNGDRGSTLVIRFLDPLTLQSGAANIGGSVLEISVEGYTITPLATLLHSAAGSVVTVRAADIMEPSPGGVPPAL